VQGTRRDCRGRAAGNGTKTFAARLFVRTGVVLTALAYALMLAFAATYWRWLAYI